jgi:hypothetical protein
MKTLLLSLLWRVPLALVVLLAGSWGVLALYFRGPESLALRLLFITLWLLPALAAMAGIAIPRSGPLTVAGPALFGLAVVVLAVWWHTITPSHDRDWAPDVARLLHATRDGDIVTLENVRNFEWRTREDFDARWETRQYDLSTLESADLVVSYWMGPAIAHTLVSFGFADGRHLVFSVEVRRTRGQKFSALGSFFRQSELVPVAADERDIVRTRSNARGESVYLYSVALSKADMRSLFEAYLQEADQLENEPRFYNTLTSNCTTIVYDMVKRIVPGLPWDYRLLASGYLPDYIYDLGALNTDFALAELERRGHINQRAITSDHDGHSTAAFSQAIRETVPSARIQRHNADEPPQP